MTSICSIINSSISNYFKCSEEKVNDFLVVYTPFSYLDGGAVCVYIKQFKDYIVLTDMGDLSAWLYSYSMTGDLTEKQKSLMEQTLNYYKISFSRGMLIKKIAHTADVTKSMLAMAQAISRISDVNYIISPRNTTDFNSDFKSFLEKNGFNYEINKSYKGNSGRERKVDFLVEGKNKNSLVYTLSLSKKKDINSKSDSTFSKWSDLLYLKEFKKVPEESSVIFVSLIDDSFIPWPQSNINLLKSVSTVERWTNKARLTKLLSSG